MATTIDLTGDGGVVKEILRPGKGAQIPAKAKAKVHYVGTFEDGKQFDSSRSRNEPFTFALGKGQVIKAWDVAVATMTLNELCKITCRYDYAYGLEGSPPTIPPKSTLVFEVELLGWEDPEPDTAPEKIKAALKRKDEGNKLFRDSKFPEAAQQYEKALSYFNNAWGFSDSEKQEADEVKLPCFLNLSACQLRTKDFDQVVLNCSKALDIDTKSVKALFRRGQAYSRMSEFDKAKSDFLEALQYEPNNKDIRNEYEHLKKKVAAYNQEKKKMFGGMFDRMKKEENVEKKEETQQ